MILLVGQTYVPIWLCCACEHLDLDLHLTRLKQAQVQPRVFSTKSKLEIFLLTIVSGRLLSLAKIWSPTISVNPNNYRSSSFSCNSELSTLSSPFVIWGYFGLSSPEMDASRCPIPAPSSSSGKSSELALFFFSLCFLLILIANISLCLRT